MTTHLPPKLPDQENAAGLYRGASIVLEEDDAFQGFLQDNAHSVTDPITQEGVAFLTRHTGKLLISFVKRQHARSVDLHETTLVHQSTCSFQKFNFYEMPPESLQYQPAMKHLVVR